MKGRCQSLQIYLAIKPFHNINKEMGSIIAKSYHHGQGGGGGGVRMRGWQKRQMSEDSISPKKIRGLDDLMAELGLDHPEWKIRGGEESGVNSV